MNGTMNSETSIDKVEDVMHNGLVECNIRLASARPVLSHLLNSGDHALYSDQVIARIRAMATHCARQLLQRVDAASGVEFGGIGDESRVSSLASSILADDSFLSHAHALTIEGLLAENLQKRSGIDPVLTPMMQEMAASASAEIAAASMHVLASQARFEQQQRRMELPLAELPGDLFHKTLLIMQSVPGLPEAGVRKADAELRATFDESNRRESQITRLMMALGRKASRALSLDHAGLALFLTAISMASSQDRDLAAFSTGETQLARLALSMRAAGMSQSALEEQLNYIHPGSSLPEHFDAISADKAIAILTALQTTDRN